MTSRFGQLACIHTCAFWLESLQLLCNSTAVGQTVPTWYGQSHESPFRSSGGLPSAIHPVLCTARLTLLDRCHVSSHRSLLPI